MNTNRLHLRFPHGAPHWARWGRRVRIGQDHYRVGRANNAEAILWLEPSAGAASASAPTESDASR